ncbi:MAG: FtsB family cell division protein [Desulfovibrionaceae bacterium]
MVRRIFFISLFIVGVFFLLRIIGENGIQAYFLLKEEMQDIKNIVQRIEEETLDISAQIRLLRSDVPYILKQAKSKIHLLDKNEILYIFEINSLEEE